MASMKVHQDLYNFKQTKKGFTNRQLAAFGLGVAAMAACVALLAYALALPITPSIAAGTIIAAPIVVAGFVDVGGMPAEEALQRALDLSSRGEVMCWQGEDVEPMRGETTRAYRKKTGKKGAECR